MITMAMRIADSIMKKLYVFVFLVCSLTHPVTCNNGNNNSTPSDFQGNVSVKCLQDCSPNATRYDYVQDSESSENVTFDPPLWCPNGYKLLNRFGMWFHLCQLKPCVTLDIGGINFTTDNLADGIEATVDQTSSAVTFCWNTSFSSRFDVCPKMLLEKGQFEINVANVSLSNLATNDSFSLDNYYILGDEAVICDDREESSVQSKKVEMPVWCMPLEISQDDFQIESNGHLHIRSLQIFVPQNYYTFQRNVSGVHICTPMDPAMVVCKRKMTPLESKMFSVLPNFVVQLHINMLKTHTFPLGHHVLALDRSMLYYCPDVKEPVKNETLYIYGTVSLVSAFFLLLALVAHMFFPNLNYHTKALLCLAFSLFVTYIVIAIRNFSSNFEPGAGNVILFAMQYIFALGAFFWLNVLAFDLWKVFSKLKGTVSAGANDTRKRIFLAKCVYAWGIPTLLCSIVIGISYSPEFQHALYLDLKFEKVSWFHQASSCAIFFYTPVIIILIENLIFFILTIVNIKKASSGTDILNKKVNQKLFKVYIKLFLVMGIFWIAEVISWFAQDLTNETTWYFTDIINSLQGVFIFLIYVCKKKTFKIIKCKLGYSSSSGTPHTSSSSAVKGRTAEIPLANIQRRNP